MSASRRRLFQLGAVTLLAGGVVHVVLVDALTLWTRRAGEFTPHRDILKAMDETTLSWGALGKTIWFRAAAGFSFWVPCSLVLFGLTFLLLSRQPEVRLRPFVILAAVLSAVFCALASTCFIWPAALGGALATAFFAASLARRDL